LFLKGQGHYIKENNAQVTLAAAKWLKGGGEKQGLIFQIKHRRNLMIRQKHTEQKKCFQRVRDEIGDRLKQFAVTGE